MPIPRGFVEVHPLEEPPFIAPAMLLRGAVLKYLRSREATGTDDGEDAQIVNGFIARAGAGRMVHEFTTRAGLGLPFKLIGEPTLNARLCAIKQGWVIWLEHTAAGTWEVGAAFDLVKLRDLQVRMREVDDELDRAVLESAGAFTAGTQTVGIEDVTQTARVDPSSARARRRAEVVKASRDERRARVFLRKLLATMPRRLADVRRAFHEAGLTLEQLHRAAVQLEAVVCCSTKKGPDSRARLMRLPSSDSFPVRIIAKTATTVRREIDRDAEQERVRDRDAAQRALRELEAAPAREEEGDGSAWIRAQLETGPRRLGDLRREIPTPETADQLVRDELFKVAARGAGVVVRSAGPRRLRGFWLELALAGALTDDAALLAAMQREGSPHIAYPKPRKWY